MYAVRARLEAAEPGGLLSPEQLSTVEEKSKEKNVIVYAPLN